MSRKRGLLPLGAFVAITAVAVIGWQIVRSASVFQTSTPQTIVDTGPQLVGIETCTECHAAQADAHKRSGHSHTFFDSRTAEISKRMDGRVYRDGERSVTHHFRTSPEGLLVSIPQVFGKRELPLEYVFGSGRHAVSFLMLFSDPDGGPHGLEARVTAFGSQEKLGLTPGHEGLQPTVDLEHFGRIHPKGELLDRCLGCHTTSFSFNKVELNHVIPNVTCESCHGPGSQHVAAMRRGDSEKHILAHWNAQAQLEVCGVCHRRTDWLGKVPDRKDKKLVRFQPVGLSQSPCYIKSEGKLACTTCHDPHDAPSEDRPAYDRRCMSCHTAGHATQKVCSVSPKEKCVECHMPRIEVSPGFIFSDHWIRIRKPDDLRGIESPRNSQPADVPLK